MGMDGKALLLTGVRSSDDTAAPFMTTEDLDYPSGDLREVSAQECNVLRLLSIRVRTALYQLERMEELRYRPACALSTMRLHLSCLQHVQTMLSIIYLRSPSQRVMF